ncbi:unannotated protein [freshwater metagenome]|uniref:Unannotated protein n=1 Tax=freshwater metagenome TaxID=449393 RepID=A0A6J7SJF0_9ZZZZ|nr:hypothetical protein [Actinomycetota bacterium]MSW37845.1 hypothetical protein [Actinomycetota bacterium]
MTSATTGNTTDTTSGEAIIIDTPAAVAAHDQADAAATEAATLAELRARSSRRFDIACIVMLILGIIVTLVVLSSICYHNSAAEFASRTPSQAKVTTTS